MSPQLTPKKIQARRWLLLAATLTALAPRVFAQSEYDPDWTKNFRIGVLGGFNIKTSFKMNGTFGISGAAPGPAGVGGANHIYNDGYVKVDSTGDKNLTWNWGINSAAQLQNNQLLMHSTDNFTTSAASEGKDSTFVGFDMAYGGIFWRQDRLRIGWELGFGLLPISVSDNSTMSARARQSTYAFNTGGIDLSTLVPNLPYRGTSQGPGPEIQNKATLVSTTPETATLTGTRTLDVVFYAFKLGPTLYWDLNRYTALEIGAGPALGLVSGNLKYNETLLLSTGNTPNVGQIGATELTYGGYINAMVSFHTVRNGDLYIGAQYMPMGNVKVSGNGRQADLNLSGQIYISAGINWPF